MGHFSQAAQAALSRRWFFFLWLPWPWAPLSQRRSPLLILTTATMASVITEMLASPTLMLVMAVTTAKGLLRPLPLPSPSPTMAIMALAITAMLATPMPMALLSMSRGLLKLPQLPNLPLILTTATTALATTVMLATPTPMVVTTMESKKE